MIFPLIVIYFVNGKKKDTFQKYYGMYGKLSYTATNTAIMNI